MALTLIDHLTYNNSTWYYFQFYVCLRFFCVCVCVCVCWFSFLFGSGVACCCFADNHLAYILCNVPQFLFRFSFGKLLFSEVDLSTVACKSLLGVRCSWQACTLHNSRPVFFTSALNNGDY